MAKASRKARSGSLVERLNSRTGEIEQATLTRIYAVAEPSSYADTEYLAGLRQAVRAAIEFGLSSLQHDEGQTPPPIPPVLLVQARLAARQGISLETVLRRYLVGYTLFGDFVIEEAATGEGQLKRILRTQAAHFDRLLESIGSEYELEVQARLKFAERSQGMKIQRLLQGELLDTSELNYDFDGWHTGIVATGVSLDTLVAIQCGSADCQTLIFEHDEEAVWAWIGSHRRLEPSEVERLISGKHFVSLALGAPGQGLTGWRLTHRQARAALQVALSRAGQVVRYPEVALLAAVLRDDLLRTSLQQLCLTPLQEDRDGGKTAQETLRAYLAAEHNVSSTAAALKVSRRTVTNRIRAIEKRLGRSVGIASADLYAALQLAELEH